MFNIPARRKNRACREAHTEGGRTVKGWYKALEDLVWLTQLGLNMLLPLVMCLGGCWWAVSHWGCTKKDKPRRTGFNSHL